MCAQVIIRWHEAELRVRASVALPAAKDENALPSMLSTLFESFAAMQVILSMQCLLYLFAWFHYPVLTLPLTTPSGTRLQWDAY